MTDYLEPLLVSLKTVTVTTAVTFFLGIAAARWMARYEGRFKSLIDGLFILPLVLPPTVVGYILYWYSVLTVLSENTPGIWRKIVFSWEATVIAATVWHSP